MKILDAAGVERDWAWLVARFGEKVSIQESEFPGAVYRIVELRQQIGPATLTAFAQDSAGNTLVGVRIVRYWPDAPLLSESFGEDNWTSRGVYGVTKETGEIGFALGRGDYYDPATQQGASALYVAMLDAGSDFISGLGMLGLTEHECLGVTFQLVSEFVIPRADEIESYLVAADESIDQALSLIQEV